MKGRGSFCRQMSPGGLHAGLVSKGVLSKDVQGERCSRLQWVTSAVSGAPTLSFGVAPREVSASEQPKLSGGVQQAMSSCPDC